MIGDKGKITIWQAVLLFVTLTASPTVRVVSGSTAREAKQAAWITPFIALFAFLIIVLVMHSMYRKYKEVSFMEIIYNITGSFIGKIIMIIYVINILILLALYIRFLAERLAMSIYPYIDIDIIIGIMLVVVAVVLRNGIENIARMNQIFFPLLLVSILIIIALMIPNVELKNLTPISYLDIEPIFIASLTPLAIWSYFTFIFFIGDKIKETENIKKYGIMSAIFLFIITTVIIIASVGTLGHSIISRSPLSFFVAVKQISFFDFIERIEALLISIWILSDFIIISVFSYILLNIFKDTFKINEIKPLVNVFMVFAYILSLYIANSAFELTNFSNKFQIYANVIIGFVFPVIIWGVGKVRKKI